MVQETSSWEIFFQAGDMHLGSSEKKERFLGWSDSTYQFFGSVFRTPKNLPNHRVQGYVDLNPPAQGSVGEFSQKKQTTAGLQQKHCKDVTKLL